MGQFSSERTLPKRKLSLSHSLVTIVPKNFEPANYDSAKAKYLDNTSPT